MGYPAASKEATPRSAVVETSIVTAVTPSRGSLGREPDGGPAADATTAQPVPVETGGFAIAGVAQPRPRTMATIFSPHSVGFCATCTPAADSASIFACAVPDEPEMMAPAWPIFRPAGAVTPAM